MIYSTRTVTIIVALVSFAASILDVAHAQDEIQLLSSIAFEGNEAFDEQQLEGLMRLHTGGLFERQPFSRRALRIDAITLKNFYQSSGYLDAQVADSFAVNQAGRVDVFLKVHEGRLYTLGTISITGERALSRDDIVSRLQLIEGAPYNPVSLRFEIQRLHDHYQDLGKLAIDIFHETTVGENIDLGMVIFEGPTFTIGQLTISGLDKVPEKYLRREFLFKAGEQFNRSLLIRSQQRIFESGLFGAVEIIPTVSNLSPNVADIEVQVRELDRRSIDLTLGFEQKEGAGGGQPEPVVGAAGQWWHSRVFNTSVRTGITVEADVVIDEVATPNLLVAWNLLSPWTAGFRIPTSLRLFTDYRRKPEFIWRTGIDLTFQTRRTRRNQWRGGIGWVLISASDPSATLENEEDRSISGSYLYQGVDNLIEPRRGTIFQIEPSLHQTFLEGNPSYFKLETDLRRYHPIFSRGVFAYRLKAGYITTFPADVALPRFDLFELGGSTSLRGWDKPNSFAPKGGTAEILANVEIRQPIFWRLGLEAFVDVGVLQSFEDVTTLERVTVQGYDVGLGVFITTPLGPIRVDVAYPFGDNTDGSPTLQAAFLYLF